MNEYPKPNLFEVATKELAQDGFLTWLLQWADPSSKKYDEKLNTCAQDFVKYLIGEDLEITTVDADRQWENVDIWVDVNEKYFIIIEDKIFSGERPCQLEKYKDKAKDWCKENNRELICVYLKTGTDTKFSIESVEKKDFRYIARSDLISFFKNYSDIGNNIYLDFVERIKNLEDNKRINRKRSKDLNWEGLWKGLLSYVAGAPQ